MKGGELMPMTLAIAVPWWIADIEHWSPRARAARAGECSKQILEGPSGGAELIYKGGKLGDTARCFNALALGIACGAYQPGGIRAFGIHWCATHHPWGIASESQVCERCVAEEGVA